MIISAIVAMNKDRIIGLENQIPWYLSADLKYFKKITIGHAVIMGRKCYQSIGKPLINRTNIVITWDPFYIISNCIICHSIEEAILIAKKNKETEVFIIGGGEIYNASKHLWDKIYLTHVDYEGPGDVYFPIIEKEKWELVSENKFLPDEKNTMSYSFRILRKL
jgi:dihydrofolate reductase